ncbi:MAG: hypothetical protein A2W00_15020 [Candidatus Eisenbacteria bacterium RBG_16_71_46]|nr:MAG: hypothetical protein A2W00_15020 [Candidatus Eisenbacteria bacterium RBG_16_71_46]
MSSPFRTGSRLSGLFRILWRMPLWAIAFALFFGTMNGATWRAYGLMYLVSLMFAYLIGLSIWANETFVRPRLQRRFGGRERVPIPLDIASYTIASLVGATAAGIILHLTFIPGWLHGARNIAIFFMFSLLFTALFTGIAYARVFYRQALERARTIERVRAELAQAELRALRAQINPHFLFNTLNSIASLIAVNPAAAEDTTTRLAEIFRYALRGSEHEHARFGDEIAFLRTYLEIEHTRFGERLRVEERIEPGLDAVPVPSLLLQPIVENAVRYGVADRPGGGTIRLSARTEGDCLVVEVADDGPGMPAGAAPSGNGFGLHSVRERLRAAGAPHALEIDSAPGRGTRVRLTLPLSPTSPPPEPVVHDNQGDAPCS